MIGECWYLSFLICSLNFHFMLYNDEKIFFFILLLDNIEQILDLKIPEYNDA